MNEQKEELAQMMRFYADQGYTPSAILRACLPYNGNLGSRFQDIFVETLGYSYDLIQQDFSLIICLNQ